MKAATVKQLKEELKELSPSDVMKLCLRLSRFKKENKELLTYLLFYTEDETGYIHDIKIEIDESFEEINTTRYYYMKKGVRKILRNIKKYIRYSTKKETEVELLFYFCQKLQEIQPSIKGNLVLLNLFNRQIAFINQKIEYLHEDLQYDYNEKLSELQVE
jgi:phosphoglycerate-specific signal transduction histidine kinase